MFMIYHYIYITILLILAVMLFACLARAIKNSSYFRSSRIGKHDGNNGYGYDCRTCPNA